MNRNTLILFGTVLVLAAVAYLLTLRPGEQSLTALEGTPLLQIDSASVDKITIESPDLALTLVKRGLEWHIEKPLAARADQNAVASLLHEAHSSVIKATVSGKPEKHPLFQVDSTGIAVKFFKENVEQGSLVVGKQGPGYSDLYVRAGNSNDVCLVDAAVSGSARRTLKDWRDRTIVPLSREGLNEIRFQYGDTSFVVTWRDSIWVVGKDPADDAVMNNLLGSLTALQADGFLDTPPTKPRLVATITVHNVQLKFFQTKGSEAYAVQSSLSPQFFELQNWRAHQILKRKRDLLKATL